MVKVRRFPDSYQLANGKWEPSVRTIVDYGDKTTDSKSEPWEEKFDSKDEANAFVQAKIKTMKCVICGKIDDLVEKYAPGIGIKGGLYLCKEHDKIINSKLEESAKSQ